jgi:thiol-disulfide isomerase/thioredoxin
VAGPVGCYLFSQLNKQPPIDAEHARTAVRLLKDRRFAFTRYAAFAGDYDPDRPLAPGKLLPEFRATALDGRTTISSAVLRGKLYLIEVWGPWCGPCVAEMPSLHAAYEKYGKRGKRKLHVLSIALDTTREDVAKFRTAPHPMPWEHALATDAEKMALRKIFGSGVPAYALIDERGTVLAATPQLRGPEFERVLSRLDEPRKPK